MAAPRLTGVAYIGGAQACSHEEAQYVVWLWRPHPEAANSFITQADGSFAVEVTIPDTPPTNVSGFETQSKAEAWIERHQSNTATGTLRSPQGRSGGGCSGDYAACRPIIAAQSLAYRP
jgi:hypothetical protein